MENKYSVDELRYSIGMKCIYRRNKTGIITCVYRGTITGLSFDVDTSSLIVTMKEIVAIPELDKLKNKRLTKILFSI